MGADIPRYLLDDARSAARTLRQMDGGRQPYGGGRVSTRREADAVDALCKFVADLKEPTP